MEVTCVYCGESFEAKRSSAKYCSDSCKSTYHRLPDRIENQHYRILEALAELKDLQKHEHLILEIDIALRHIRNKCLEVEHNVDYSKIVRLENEKQQREIDI